jgi:hypothetical protein
VNHFIHKLLMTRRSGASQPIPKTQLFAERQPRVIAPRSHGVTAK